MNLNSFRTLGRSGLVVSPLTLGTMTFGTPRWGSSDEVSQAIFNAYIDAGGNFVDTADVYSGGRSEELLGGFINSRKLRDKLVLATKFTFNTEPGNPNAGGNGRKNIYSSIEGSLRRLKTGYIDLYWLHAWDMVTPVEEVFAISWRFGAWRQNPLLRLFEHAGLVCCQSCHACNRIPRSRPYCFEFYQ